MVPTHNKWNSSDLRPSNNLFPWCPMSRLFFKLIFLVLFPLICGCAPKTTVVLLSDPDGQTGNLTVATAGGEVTMDKAAEATVFAGRDSRPSTPEILSEEQITSQFSVVLAALPTQPQHFLLYFQKGVTDLTPESEALLPRILQTITERKSENIRIIGHSDTAGNREYNLSLSKERAMTVSRMLMHQGIAETHMSSTSHGEENPLIKTADNVEEEKNRRVEVVVQ